MKQILLSLCAIWSISVPTTAQLTTAENSFANNIRMAGSMNSAVSMSSYSSTMERYAFIQSLSNSNVAAKAAKASAMKQRITGISWVDSTDWAEAAHRRYTVAFYYKNNQRGSDFDYQTMSYVYDYPLDRVPFFYYNIASANFQGVRSDSTVRMEWCDNSSQLERRLAYGLSYNEGNNRITGSRKYNLLCGGNLNDATKTEEVYDAAGRVSERSAYYLNPASSSWELYGRQFFRYNTAGKKLVDSVASYFGGAWNPENRLAFSYDAAGNPISISFEQYLSGSFKQQALLQATFYVGGEPKTIQLSELTPANSSVVPTSLDSFGYTSGAPCFTYALVSNYSGSNLVLAGKQIRHLNAQMKPDSITEYTYSGNQPVFSKLAVYTYNSAGNPTMSRLYPAVAGGVVTDTVVVERYTYQDYNETVPTVVKSLTPINAFSVYPNPAKGNLNIRCQNAGANQSGRVRVVNGSGQTVVMENIQWSNGAHTLQLDGLTPGIYHLLIEGATEGTGFHQSFIKE